MYLLILVVCITRLYAYTLEGLRQEKNVLTIEGKYFVCRLAIKRDEFRTRTKRKSISFLHD